MCIRDSDITVDIDFTIVGDVTATVGPLSDVMVNVPAHSHYFVTAVQSGIGGDPLIRWQTKALFGYVPYGFQNNQNVQSWIGDKLGRLNWPTEGGPWANSSNLYYNNPGSTSDFTGVREQQKANWLAYLSQLMPDFANEWDKVYNAPSLGEEVLSFMQSINEHDQSSGGATIRANTWWVNPGDSVPDDFFYSLNNDSGTGGAVYSLQTAAQGLLAGTTGTTTEGSSTQSFPYNVWNAKVVAAIDTRTTTFTIEPYSPPILHEDINSETAMHSHYLSDYPLTDPTTDYGYGNIGGAGHKKGLGSSAATTRIVTFDQDDVNIELNTATFTLNKGTKLPAPNVKLHPNRKVELVPKFHKVKYIIKAF